jgi:hypothetical protein
MRRGFYNTLDLDKYDKESLTRVMIKIGFCPHCIVAYCVDSPQKGYHVSMYCRIPGCDTCRFVFDDSARYAIDFRRPPELTNVLFQNIHAHEVNRTKSLEPPGVPRLHTRQNHNEEKSAPLS